jgi:hypothetical protein
LGEIDAGVGRIGHFHRSTLQRRSPIGAPKILSGRNCSWQRNDNLRAGASLSGQDSSIRRVVEKPFCGVDDSGVLVGLAQGTALIVIGTEQADGFVRVECDGKSIRVLAVDLNSRSSRVQMV